MATWRKPDGFVDSQNKWTDESLAYDGDTGTYAWVAQNLNAWCDWIRFTYSQEVTNASKLRVWVSKEAGATPGDWDIHLYDGLGGSQSLYQSTLAEDQYVELAGVTLTPIAYVEVRVAGLTVVSNQIRVNEIELYGDELPTTIDVGSDAIDRATFLTYNYTVIDKTNPANLSGRITSVALYAVAEMSGIKVGIFTEGPADTFTVRDWQALANCPAGYKEYAVDLTVEAGDFIGVFYTGGTLEVDTASGEGWWLENADYIPCTGQVFAFTASRAASIYGIGTTESSGGGSRQGFFIGQSIDSWINDWIGAFVDQDNSRRG